MMQLNKLTAAVLLTTCLSITGVSAQEAESTPENSGFRFTYPVRDNGSDQVTTERKPAPVETSSSADIPTPPPMDTSIASINESPGNQPFVSPTGFEGELAPAGGASFADLPFFFSFSLNQGYNSNVNTQNTDGVESLYTEISGGVGYEFGSSRLQLSTSLSGALTFYYNNADLNYDGIFPTVNFVLSANYSATPRLDLSAATTTQLLSQPNYTVSGAPDTDQGPYILSISTFGAKYLWLPKLATETTYSPSIFYFLDPGENASDFSRLEQTLAEQFIYLWKPQTSLVAEYRFNTRNYFDNDRYNSYGNYALLGIDHTINPRSTLTFRGGAEQRINQNPDTSSGSNSYIGPFSELNLNYSLNPNTVVGLTSRYGTTASGLDNYNQGQQFLLGINAGQQFTRRIAANAYLNYQNNYYNQPDSNQDSFYDNVYNLGINMSFKINRHWSLTAGYAYTFLDSTNATYEKDYDQNILFIGTELDF